MTLAPALHRDIVDVLIPHFIRIEDRYAIIGEAFPNQEIQPFIVFSGTANNFTLALISRLVLHGDVIPDEPSLVTLLKVVWERVGHPFAAGVSA